MALHLLAFTSIGPTIEFLLEVFVGGWRLVRGQRISPRRSGR
jgi:hypothetical protein